MPPLTIEQALQLARQHHQAGQLPQAEALYRRILQQQPNHPDALHLLGVIAYQGGQQDLAMHLIRQAITLNPQDPDAYVNLAVVLKDQGQLDAAIAACRQAIALNPGSPNAYGNLGNALLSKGQFDEAIAAFRQAIDRNPNLPEAYNNLANALQANGQLAAAGMAFRQAIALKPHFPEAHNNLGVTLMNMGQSDAAIAAFRQAIALKPRYAEALYNFGTALRDTGRLDEAIAAYRQAIALNPNHPGAFNNLGNALQSTGQLAAAIAAYRQAIALDPNCSDAYGNLGAALKDQGELDAAIAACRQAIALKPAFPEAHNNLGNALQAGGRPDEAAAAYRQAIDLNPRFSEACNNLGVALRDLGQYDAAIAACRHAIALKPAFRDACNNLGNALQSKGLCDDAIAAYRHAIALQPSHPDAYSNLGSALQFKGQLDDALVAYRQAIALNPALAEAYSNLGTILKDLGQIDAALAACRQALALKPDYPDAHSNLLVTLNYHPASTAESLFQEACRWAQRHAEPLKQFIQPHAHDRNPERRLRIGYVSPDFREHAVAPMVLPLIASHDRTQFDVFCYAQVERPDAMTEKFRAQAGPWRSTVGLSDERMAGLIRQDQIDILVDLAGHTAGSRLLVFARKPAPVQVNRQGYPNTTGLTAIDYRMTDAYADPPGLSDTLHSEQLIRLPQTNWIYQPPADCPVPTPRPAGMPVTFGCFNHFAKVTEPMLRLWARILAAVPGSRLLLKAMGLASPDVRARVRGIFQGEGLAPERVELAGWRSSAEDHLALYGRVAIALDPFPYHGTTTTCEALWMGVPVITLAGRMHVSRVGVSLLTNVGLPELIAETPEAYVRIAVDLAGDPPRLDHLRATLRPRMAQSPLLDAPRFARHIEAAYRQMWRRWCATA